MLSVPKLFVHNYVFSQAGTFFLEQMKKITTDCINKTRALKATLVPVSENRSGQQK